MILRSRYILPEPAASVCTPGYLRIEGGRLVEVGEGTPEAASGEAVRDLGNALVMPGLAMAHTHVDYGSFRGHGDGHDFLPWIRSLQARKGDGLSPEHYLASARLSCLELVAAGVTAVGEATDPSESAARALVEAGLRGICFQEDFAPDPAHAQAVLARVAGKLDRLLELTEGTRVRVGVSPHAPYTLSRELFAGLVELGRARGMPLSIHIAESEDEVALVRHGAGPMADGLRGRGIEVEARGVGPYRYLADQGWLAGPQPVLLVHGVQLDPQDLVDLAPRDHVWLVHCPRSNARLGEGVAPIPEALEAGVRVALGTDGACSADRLDPFEEMRAALWLARATRRRAGALSAQQVLSMALEGHRALGFGPGRLEVGAPADLCALSLDSPHMVPFAPGPEAVVLQAAASDVVMTMVGGEVLFDHGEHTRVDAAEIMDAARVLSP